MNILILVLGAGLLIGAIAWQQGWGRTRCWKCHQKGHSMALSPNRPPNCTACGRPRRYRSTIA